MQATLEGNSLLSTIEGMKVEYYESQPALEVRVTYSEITEDRVQRSLFHLFDLLALDKDLVPLHLRKRLERLRCNSKGEVRSNR